MNPFENWFQYVCRDNEHKYKEFIRRTLAPVMARGLTPIMKDPIAIFSADWLSRTFGMDVLVMIRHPAAFCSSLKVKGWQHDFTGFIRQPLLMEHLLKKFEDDIRRHASSKQDIVSQGILLYNCIYHVVDGYRRKHPEWTFVRHEDLSLNPVEEYRKIYGRIKLEFTPAVEARILETSGPHNPAEPDGRNEFVRNSREVVDCWKRRLTDAEIGRILSGTSDTMKLFYE